MQLELLLLELLVLQHVQLLLLQHQHRVRRRLTAVRHSGSATADAVVRTEVLLPPSRG